MPSHRVHNFVDRQMFGKSYWQLHRNLDLPYLFMGRKHRVLFHDGFSSVLIARRLYPGDSRAEQAAIVHCQIDALCSNDPFLRTQLEFLANLDAAERKKTRRKSRKRKASSSGKRKQADPLKDFVGLMEKMVEIKKLAKMLAS